MNYRSFVLAAILGLAGVGVIALLSHMSGSGDIDPTYIFKGDIVKRFAADELVEAFKKDAVDAEYLYADKGIEVAGEVFDASSSPMRLGDDGHVACYFPESIRDEVRDKVTKGQFVKVKGLCMGIDKRVRAFVVTLKGCTLVESPPMMPPFHHP
jgi:hypothetical protein